MKIGTTDIVKAMRGTTEIQKIMRGLNIVWENWKFKTGMMAYINNVASPSFRGNSITKLNEVSNPVKPLKLYFNITGRFQDNPWGNRQIKVTLIANDDSETVIFNQNLEDGQTWTTTRTIDITDDVECKGYKIEVSGKTTCNITSYFSEWMEK